MKNITLKHFNISFLSNTLPHIHFHASLQDHFENGLSQRHVQIHENILSPLLISDSRFTGTFCASDIVIAA